MGEFHIRAWASVGGLKKHAMYGHEAAVDAARAGQRGLRKRFAGEIIALSDGREPCDLEQRIDQRIRAHMKAIRVRSVELKAAQKRAMENERIRAIVSPPVVCAWCAMERGDAVPSRASSTICADHRKVVRR